MSAAAITWAISPPITPAPTTAALNTNMTRNLAELDLGLALVGEAAEGAPQGVGHGPAHEQQVDRRGERIAVLDLVLERERHLDVLGPRREGDPLTPAERLVLDFDGLAGTDLVGDHALLDHPAAARWGRPQQAGADLRPLALELDDVPEAVDPRGPAGRVVPERLGLGRPAGHEDGGPCAAHQQRSSVRMARIEPAMRSRRGPSSEASRRRSAWPASVTR